MSKATKVDIARAVLNEREYQDAKWGTVEERPHTVGEWLLIAESELNEAKQAWCKGKGDYGALEELLQVVAVGFACLEQHGVIENPQRLLATKLMTSRPNSGKDAIGAAVEAL